MTRSYCRAERARGWMQAMVVSTIAVLVSTPLPAQSPPVRDSAYRAHAVHTHSSGITSSRFSPNGQFVATATLRGDVCVFTVPALTRRWCASHGTEVYSVRWSANGETVASSGGDARVVQWSAARGVRRSSTSLPHRALTLAWSGDSMIVAPTVDGEVMFIASQSGRARVAWTLPKEVLAAAISPDGQWLATGVPVEQHRLRDGGLGRRLLGFGQGGIAYHPTRSVLGVAEWVAGARLVTLGDSAQSVGLRLPTVQEFAGLRADTATVNMPSTDITFTPSGSHVVVAGTDGGVWMWALDSEGRATPAAKTWPAHYGTVTAVDLSKDSRWLISAGLDRQLKLWRMPQ